jgi:hypothetical protein
VSHEDRSFAEIQKRVGGERLAIAAFEEMNLRTTKPPQILERIDDVHSFLWDASRGSGNTS